MHRKELRKYFGHRWRQARRRALNARGHQRCDACGADHPLINWAHLDHDPARPLRMAWFCPTCHGKHDTPHRVAVTRRTMARRHRQMWLTPELEFAAAPVRLWPMKLRQLDLFAA